MTRIAMSQPHVRYCRSFDGAEIAYAVSGDGPPVILLPSWLTHLDAQWRSVAWRPWLDALSPGWQLIRYDPRGCGLSERRIDDLSFDSWVRDLEALVGAIGLKTFSLVGICQGGPIAIDFAARHPERIERLVLFGTYARGRHRRPAPVEPEKARVMLQMMEVGWAHEDEAFMTAFAKQFQPGGTIEHLRSWCELQRVAASPQSAVALTRIMFDIDVLPSARRLACPTLVAHAERDAAVPAEEGRLLAQTIPDARFLPLDSPNHFMLADEPAWLRFVDALHGFLPRKRPEAARLADLTEREREVLAGVARGLDNHQIAARLDISEKTVRNHVSSLLAKLGVDTRARAIVTAIAAGLWTPYDDA